jgi:hypothetical protein
VHKYIQEVEEKMMTKSPSKATNDVESDDSSIHGHIESNLGDNIDNDKSMSMSMSRQSSAQDTSSSDDVAIGKEESVHVFRLRILVLLAIFSAAVAVSLVVYFLTANSQTDEFETQFEGASSKILTSFEEIVDRKLVAIGSFALQASLFAASLPNASWPLVTLSDYQLRAAVTRELSGSLFVRLCPVVVDETREAWEKYSVENLWWLDEARAYNEEKGLGFTRRLEGYAYGSSDRGVDFSAGIGDKIYGFDETFTPTAMAGPGPYIPLWQESPTFGRDMINYDTMAYPDYAPFMKQAFLTGEMSIGGLDTAPPGNTTHPDISTSYFAALESMKAGEEVTYMGDPMSSVFFPVFEDVNSKERKVVAVVFAVFKWAFYFESLLPPHFPGLILVLENNCDGPFTYKVVGEEVEYLGAGDLHQSFSGRPDMVRTVDFGSTNDIGGKGSTLAVKLNQDICNYKLSVYPSQELEDQYMTYLPLGVTLAVAMVFVITALVFLVFNGYVERRQTLVMEQAVKSTAIVSALFPEAVRDRLMGAEYASGKTRLKSFVNGNEADAQGQPIADLCKCCHHSSFLLSHQANLIKRLSSP